MASTKATTGRREQILEIATHLFQKGFRATSLDHVATALGVTRPALYYYFKSKEELLAAIYDRAVGVLIDRAAALFAQDLAPDVLLRRLIEVHVGTMLQEQAIVRVYFQEKDSLGDVASRSVKAKEVEFTKMMASTIKAGQKQGIFRPGKPELIVNAILGMLIWVYQWYRPDRHSEKEIREMFWLLLGDGLVTKSKRPVRASQVTTEAVRRKASRRANGGVVVRASKS